MKETVKEVYVTKYWETAGIIKMEVTQSENFPTMVSNIDNSLQVIHKPHWYDNKGEAIAFAEKLRIKRIKSIKAKLKALETLKF